MSPLSKKVLIPMVKEMSKSSLCANTSNLLHQLVLFKSIVKIYEILQLAAAKLALSKSNKNHLQASKAH